MSVSDAWVPASGAEQGGTNIPPNLLPQTEVRLNRWDANVNPAVLGREVAGNLQSTQMLTYLWLCLVRALSENSFQAIWVLQEEGFLSGDATESASVLTPG